ncbi:MAG: hypothetical protein SF066_07810 [Thermoanaerobaculia bacterium]|nr:hypothetical protein [Thermoanaerobaculia bacterium]
MRPALIGVLLVVFAVPAFAGDAPLVAESDLFVPEVLETAACWSCSGNYTTSPGGGAASHWGKGSSCTAATNDFNNQTFTAATTSCYGLGAEYACSVSRVVTAACFWNGSMYQVDGYANYRCRFWIGGPGCIIP